MTTTTLLLLLLGLFTKHLIVDFPLQGPYQYLNKGTYGHPGGIEHSLYHLIGTFLVFIWLGNMQLALLLAGVDAVIHYHVDWAKMNLNKKFGYGPTTHEQFWWLLGVDQFAHCITYLGLAWAVSA